MVNTRDPIAVKTRRDRNSKIFFKKPESSDKLNHNLGKRTIDYFFFPSPGNGDGWFEKTALKPNFFSARPYFVGQLIAA